jgi:pimeloyl-ACP methyl ester carboxylesterase
MERIGGGSRHDRGAAMYDVRPLLDSDPQPFGTSGPPDDLGRFAESARFARHYPEQNPVLRDLLPTITTPTQIVAGRNDELVPWSNNQYLDQLLPSSEIHPLNAGHFAWDQAPEEYGRLVAEWVSGGYRRPIAG